MNYYFLDLRLVFCAQNLQSCQLQEHFRKLTFVFNLLKKWKITLIFQFKNSKNKLTSRFFLRSPFENCFSYFWSFEIRAFKSWISSSFLCTRIAWFSVSRSFCCRPILSCANCLWVACKGYKWKSQEIPNKTIGNTENFKIFSTKNFWCLPWVFQLVLLVLLLILQRWSTNPFWQFEFSRPLPVFAFLHPLSINPFGNWALRLFLDFLKNKRDRFFMGSFANHADF